MQPQLYINCWENWAMLGNLRGLKWQLEKQQDKADCSLLLFRWLTSTYIAATTIYCFYCFCLGSQPTTRYLPWKMTRCWYCILLHTCSRSRLWYSYWVQGYCQLFVHLICVCDVHLFTCGGRGIQVHQGTIKLSWYFTSTEIVKLLLAYLFRQRCPIPILSLRIPATVIQDEAMKGVD